MSCDSCVWRSIHGTLILSSSVIAPTLRRGQKGWHRIAAPLTHAPLSYFSSREAHLITPDERRHRPRQLRTPLSLSPTHKTTASFPPLTTIHPRFSLRLSLPQAGGHRAQRPR